MATDSSRLDVLRRRVQQDPASIAFAPLAEELRRAGEHYEAVRVCLAGLEHHPAFLSARVTLGRALAALDQYQEARTEFEYVLKVAPDNLLASRSLTELEAQCLVAAPQQHPSLEELEAWLARIEADRAANGGSSPRSEPHSLAAGVDGSGSDAEGDSGVSARRNPSVLMALPTSSQLSARQAQVRRRVAALNLEAFVVTNPANIRYLSNHVGSSGVLILTRDSAHLLVDARYSEAVRMLQQTASACPALLVRNVPDSYDDAVLQCLGDIGATAVGFEAAQLSVARHDVWRRTADRLGVTVDFHATERIVEEARLVKDAYEIATLRDAAARLTPVAASAFEAVAAGGSERDVAAVLEAALRRAGYERPAFDTIVASGPHAALPHHRAGDRILCAGDLVVLDFGGVLDGYCSDLTRTVSIGPPSPEAQRLYSAVYDAQQAAIRSIRPGVESVTVDAAARSILQDRGLGEAFGHGTGHGLGLDIHEEPRISRPRPDVPSVRLAPGMVVTIEPGAYLPGFGGVRIEDDVLVTETGCDVLTTVSRELRSL